MTPLERARMYIRRNGVIDVLRKVFLDPSKVLMVYEGEDPHFYAAEMEISTDEIVEFTDNLCAVSSHMLQEYHQEILNMDDFRESIEERLGRTTERPNLLHRNWREVLYVLVRAKDPRTIVETGVFDGLSSAYILQGLERNDSGRLVSIDINDTSRLPQDIEDVNAGWIVPERLQDRWSLEMGDSKDILPEVADVEEIDYFLHDSLHTREHMMFEFETVYPSMTPDGIMLSDNVEFNDAFRTFAMKNLKSHTYMENTENEVNLDSRKVKDKIGAGLVKG